MWNWSGQSRGRIFMWEARKWYTEYYDIHEKLNPMLCEIENRNVFNDSGSVTVPLTILLVILGINIGIRFWFWYVFNSLKRTNSLESYILELNHTGCALYFWFTKKKRVIRTGRGLQCFDVPYRLIGAICSGIKLHWLHFWVSKNNCSSILYWRKLIQRVLVQHSFCIGATMHLRVLLRNLFFFNLPSLMNPKKVRKYR